MRIVSWNVNGIRACLKKGFQDWFEVTNADVFCLQETRALEEQLDDSIVNPPGFHSGWNPAEKKGYSGVAIFSKIEPDSIQTGIGVEEFDKEGRVIRFDFGDTVLFNIYFPNGSGGDDRLDFKLRFYDRFLQVCNKLVAEGKNVITCGDYNTCHKEIDIARPKPNEKNSGFLPIEREWMDKYVDNGYVDTFRILHPEAKEQYSWWSNRGGARERNVGWRIDYFFVNSDIASKVKQADIWQHVLGSDHCPIFLEIDI